MRRIPTIATVFFASLAAPGRTLADARTLAEMDACVTKLEQADLKVISALEHAPALYVGPAGRPDNPGTEQAPLDLATALSENAPVKPGTVVWLEAGTYQGPFDKSAQPAGTAKKPLVYRSRPGARVTITAGPENQHIFGTHSDHTWFWGLEIAAPAAPAQRGHGITIITGHGVKLINLVVHDCPNRSGIAAFDVGNDHELYGCLVYRNGYDSERNRWSHGIYTQNTKKHTVKRLSDCFFFDNFGFGVHCYGEAPALANYCFTGVAAWGNGLVEGAGMPVVNFLVGGYKDQDNMIVRQCFTHFPDEGKFKRGADIGYVAKHNGQALVEDCTFVGGIPALQIVNWEKITFRRNRLASSHGLVHFIVAPARELSSYAWGENLYFDFGMEKPFSSNPDAYKWRQHRSSEPYSFAEWQAAFGLDRNSTLKARPEGVWTILRPNKYEPARAHLLVYNWTGKKEVAVDLADLVPAGRNYEIRRVRDLWGDPVNRGVADGKPVTFLLTGPYAPGFEAFVVRRLEP